MLDPLTFTTEVPCSQEKAFSIFVNDMGNWWPVDKRSMSLMSTGKPAKSVSIEPKLGGKIVELTADDEELLWGTIRTYDPNDALALNFHMGLPPENASLVEIRFTALGDERTKVELTHSNWEAFGDMAEMMRGGYNSGWVIIFEEAYASACGS